MGSALQILLALAAGLLLGIAASRSGDPAFRALPDVFSPIGTLFINAIRMTVVPLVVSKLIVGVASRKGDAGVARLGSLAVAAFVVLLLLASSFSAAVAWPAMSALPLGTSVAGSMGSAADPAAAATGAPSFGDFIEGLIPANPVRAAGDAAMLPLIVFAVLLGLALGRVPEAQRSVMVTFFEGLGDAMLVIVRWVLRFAPLGVFALAVPVFARLGLDAVSAVIGYVAMVALVTVTFSLIVLYPLGVLAGRVPLGRFAREIAPAQAIAFTSRSSLASLPVMLDQGARLGLPAPIVSFILPLAASMFRVGSVMGTTIGALFVARLHGVPLDAGQVVAIVSTAVMIAFGSPGVPSGSILVIVPILASAGLPADGVGILLAVDPVPDMFRTTTNITGNMSVACALTRAFPRGSVAEGPDPEATRASTEAL